MRNATRCSNTDRLLPMYPSERKRGNKRLRFSLEIETNECCDAEPKSDQDAPLRSIELIYRPIIYAGNPPLPLLSIVAGPPAVIAPAKTGPFQPFPAPNDCEAY